MSQASMYLAILQVFCATLVHFSDTITGHNGCCTLCAMCHTQGALCTFTRVYGMNALD